MNSSFAALADIRRTDILDVLRGGGRSVGEIRAVVGMDEGAVSKSLKALREAGLVNVRKDGRRRIYQLDTEIFARLAERLGSYAQEMAPASGPVNVEPYPMLRLLLNARLMRFFYLIRELGSGDVAEMQGCSLLCRNILSLVGTSKGVTWTDLVAFSGEEKGQVSRAVKMLSELGLLARVSLRAKITLTSTGEDVFGRFMTLAVPRDGGMCAGLTQDQVAQLRSLTHILTERAVLLLGEEQALSSGFGLDAGVDRTVPAAVKVPRFDGMLGELVTPGLLRLAAYLRRSATIAYRREAGLSNLAWLTITHIGEHEQLNLTDLSNLIGRDKGQVSRIVRDHKDAGLVKRQRSAGDGRTGLALTAVGKDINKRMCDRALKRDEFMFRNITPEERLSYISSLDVLIKNAAVSRLQV